MKVINHLQRRIGMRTDLKQVVEALMEYTAKGKKPNVHILYVNVGPSGNTDYISTAVKAASKKGVEGYLRNDLTRGVLINGVDYKGKDVSLLPHLNGKVLILRDMSFLLEKERVEVRYVLRNAFDGQVSMYFGNGVQRFYKTSFNFLGTLTEGSYHKLCLLDSSFVDRLIVFVDGFLLERASERWLLHTSSFLGMLHWNKTITQKIYKRYFRK